MDNVISIKSIDQYCTWCHIWIYLSSITQKQVLGSLSLWHQLSKTFFWLDILYTSILHWVSYLNLFEQHYTKTSLGIFVVMTVQLKTPITLGWQQPSKAFFWFDTHYRIVLCYLHMIISITPKEGLAGLVSFHVVWQSKDRCISCNALVCMCSYNTKSVNPVFFSSNTKPEYWNHHSLCPYREWKELQHGTRSDRMFTFQ